MKKTLVSIGLSAIVLAVAAVIPASVLAADNDINPRMSQQRCRVLFKRQNNYKCTGCLNQYCRTMRPDIAYKYCATKRYCDRKLYKNEPPRPSKRGVDNRMGRKNCLALSKKQTHKRCYMCLATYCEKLWPSEAYEACVQRKQCDNSFKKDGDPKGDDDDDDKGDDDDDDKGKTRSELKKAYKDAKKAKSKAWDKYKKERSKAKKKYNKERGPAREEYRDAKDRARNVYREKKIEARAKYKKRVKSAKNSYSKKEVKAEEKYGPVYTYYKDAKSAYKKCISDDRSPVSCRRLKDNYERAKKAKNDAKKVRDKEIDDAERYRDNKLEKAKNSYEKARNRAKRDYEDAKEGPRSDYDKAKAKARKKYDKAKKKARSKYDKVKAKYYKAKKAYEDSKK